MTDIDTDKLSLISDSPFLMCVFYVPSNDRNEILMKPRAIRNERTVRNFSETLRLCCDLRCRSYFKQKNNQPTNKQTNKQTDNLKQLCIWENEMVVLEEI